MIPYYGLHGAKQFFRGKQVRFEYKMWALTTTLGYVLQFEPYQGTRVRQASDMYSLIMGHVVVMDLLQELTKATGYHLIFDNLFASLSLVDDLTTIGGVDRVDQCNIKAKSHKFSHWGHKYLYRKFHSKFRCVWSTLSENEYRSGKSYNMRSRRPRIVLTYLG